MAHTQHNYTYTQGGHAAHTRTVSHTGPAGAKLNQLVVPYGTQLSLLQMCVYSLPVLRHVLLSLLRTVDQQRYRHTFAQCESQLDRIGAAIRCA